jgi:hypothetical protein
MPFHVKQIDHSPIGPRLLADTKLAKDDVEKILDIDPAGDPPKRVRRPPQLFGDHLGTGGR